MLTVTTPATSERLANPVRIVSALGQAGVTVSSDAAGVLADDASAVIARWCRRAFGSATYSEVFRRGHCDYPERLVLARWPVSAIASVTVDGVALSASDYELDSSMLYRLSSDLRVRWSGEKVTVAYVAGYALPDSAPADLERACIAMAVALYHGQGRDTAKRSEMVDGIGSISWRDADKGGAAIPADVEQLIGPYREVLL